MTVSTGSYLKNMYNAATAMGKKAVSSDAAFQIQGFEEAYLLIKAFPTPISSPKDVIEIFGPLGMSHGQPAQIGTLKQGSITLMETVAGHIDDMLINLIAGGGTFNAKVYEGTPDKFYRYKQLNDCFFVLDDGADRDFENRTQILTFTGTLHYHYFGETVPGNLTAN